MQVEAWLDVGVALGWGRSPSLARVQVSSGEEEPGVALQVGFEFAGARLASKCCVKFQLPGPEFCCVQRTARVVDGNAGSQIRRIADVESTRVDHASKDVGVVHGER